MILNSRFDSAKPYEIQIYQVQFDNYNKTLLSIVMRGLILLSLGLLPISKCFYRSQQLGHTMAKLRVTLHYKLYRANNTLDKTSSPTSLKLRQQCFSQLEPWCMFWPLPYNSFSTALYSLFTAFHQLVYRSSLI